MDPVTLLVPPGLNNVMLTASGANYGLRRTLPHMLGIVSGCIVLFTAIALGLGLVFERYPPLQTLLRVVGSVFLLYLAWGIATAPPPQLKGAVGRPLSLLQAAGFQFANPKAWVMGLTLMASFLPEQGNVLVNAMLLAGFAELVALPCILLWAGLAWSSGNG